MASTYSDRLKFELQATELMLLLGVQHNII